eukprot:scaffold4264_cov116-Isochrysis_galbana.AAC.18
MRHFMVSVRPGWTWGDERCYNIAAAAISISLVVCFTITSVVLSCSHARVFTHPRLVEGPEELNFARVGGGRPNLADGRGVGAGLPVSILEDASA